MNHDYAHCISFREDCPQKCFRAQLSRDAINNRNVVGIWMTFMNFRGTEECMRKDGDHAEGTIQKERT
jgi:hypothetical protein